MVASCCSSPDTIDGSFATGAPTISLAFYPNATGQNLGTNPSFNDHKMLLDAHVTTPQTKYWKFLINTLKVLVMVLEYGVNVVVI